MFMDKIYCVGVSYGCVLEQHGSMVAHVGELSRAQPHVQKPKMQGKGQKSAGKGVKRQVFRNNIIIIQSLIEYVQRKGCGIGDKKHAH